MAVVEDSWWDELGEIYCLTFIRGVDGQEALRRMGGLADTVATRTWADLGELHNFDAGYPMVAGALPLAGWTVVFEPNGFEGAHLTAEVSRGTEAVAVLRHDYASPTFSYAVAGEVVTEFDPTFPAYRHGTGPDRLAGHMHEVGFPLSEDEDSYFSDAISRALSLTERITGVLPAFEALTGPLLSAHLEPWFTDAPREPAGRPGHDGPVDAVGEVRRLTESHGLTDTPGLADALAAAERGEHVRVTPESPLGRHVREWLTVSRQASWSLNDHSGYRMTEAERRRAFELGWLARALGAAIQPEAVRGRR